MSETNLTLTGGCQCGAVRYALAEQPGVRPLCHCRMCQKAVGGPVRRALAKCKRAKLCLDPRRAGQLPKLLHCRAAFLHGMRHAADVPAAWTATRSRSRTGSLDPPAAAAANEELRRSRAACPGIDLTAAGTAARRADGRGKWQRRRRSSAAQHPDRSDAGQLERRPVLLGFAVIGFPRCRGQDHITTLIARSPP